MPGKQDRSIHTRKVLKKHRLKVFWKRLPTANKAVHNKQRASISLLYNAGFSEPLNAFKRPFEVIRDLAPKTILANSGFPSSQKNTIIYSLKSASILSKELLLLIRKSKK